MSISAVGIPSSLSTSGIILAHPTLEESNLLCKVFFDNVNPFMRVLHESLFAREIGQYRRGTFHLPGEFEALLFSMYALAVNSLQEDFVQSVFSTSKDILLSRFQYSAQVALVKVNFLKTETVHGLGALLHYLVSPVLFV
jgi:hypothetical protein